MATAGRIGRDIRSNRNSKPAETGPGYEQLACWQLADELAVQMYKLTKPLIRYDLWLRSQIMKAVFSVPSNIVEGYARASNKEFNHFLEIAHGSLAEVEYQIHFMKRTEIIDAQTALNLRTLVRRSGQTLFGLMASVRRDIESGTHQRRYLAEEPAKYITESQFLAAEWQDVAE